ncbi:MAG TPA: biopolymer transporter ExbD [Bryobacteraceae bacterium]|jgi:biopolymer transport protein ExbD
MAMSVGYRKGEINITPMIDILLVLIIIFMVIQPEYSTGLDTAVPKPAPPGSVASDSGDVLILVHGDGTVLLNEEAVAVESLESRLRDFYKRAAQIAVFIQADKDADFGQVAEVIDLANGVGIKKVGLLPR